MNSKKKITFSIEFDEKQMPEKIIWEKNEDMPSEINLKSLFLSGWEVDSQTSATLNLWTTDLRVDEMQQVLVQSVLSMASGYQKATGDNQMLPKMKTFFEQYGKKA